MSKLQLFILDDDMAYAERLAAFIRSTAFVERIQVKLYSQSDRLLEVLEDSQIEGVLLISEAYYPLLEQIRTQLFPICLSENITNSNDSEIAIPFLFRFQPLQSLLSRILALYAEGLQRDRKQLSGARRTRVLTVYSSSGNSGKSITAVHLAKQLAFRGERVMYVSLESISAASQWFQGETGRLSQLLYFLKSSPEMLGAKLELLKSHDTNLRIDYLTPHDQMREMQEMIGEHVRQLIESILQLSVYDTLILDLESSVHPRIVKSLEMSDEIIWLIRDDWNDAFKTKSLYKQMNAYQPIHFVMTSYRGTQTNSYDFIDRPISYRLPYIPEWKVLRAPEQIWQSEIFAEQVYGMLTSILKDKRNSTSHMEGDASLFESRAV
ncbi:hypothetical protein A8709_25960 [Paenibacillus pectinilyticus]|uniref:AAA domain-containing protein n=1 Tax=Paenibacillus pectinilyticus TaxID=512399 RepID=A0A1C1A173_9BACL|nr:ParA family protein [Paenibacillus pectinilyticus]OCT14277.1 hypothetical protein A8709_25960 [Paenibacillus pectinilyticus]